MTRFQKIVIGLSLLMALGIRMHAVLNDRTTGLRGDASGYDEIATNIAQGKGIRFEGKLTASRDPLYPIFLAGIYRTVGHSYRAARIVQAILSTLTVLGIALWAYTLFGGWSACFAALISSVYPAFYAYYFSCTALITETLYTFLFTAALYTFYVYWTRPSWIWAVISGLCWGLSHLTRPHSSALLILLPLILIPLRYPLRHLLRYCGIVWFVVGLVVAPWIIRNYLVFHAFFPLSTSSVAGFYTAQHPEDEGLGGSVWRNYFVPEDERLQSLGMSEAERANYFLRKGFGFIRAYPGNTLRLFVRRIFLYLDPRTTLFHKEDQKQVVTWGYLFVLAGTVVGFFLSLRHEIDRREILSLCLIFGLFILFHGFAGASERYRFPNEPILIVITSFALDLLIKRGSKANLETARQ